MTTRTFTAAEWLAAINVEIPPPPSAAAEPLATAAPVTREAPTDGRRRVKLVASIAALMIAVGVTLIGTGIDNSRFWISLPAKDELWSFSVHLGLVATIVLGMEYVILLALAQGKQRHG
jgi:hypothetical protein